MFTNFQGDTADDVWFEVATEFFKGSMERNSHSRGGPTAELLHATISVKNPLHRWIISRNPVINLAFALAEIIWIVRGRSDSLFLTFFNSQLPKFTGATEFLHGAYGQRLRGAFGIDQLESAYRALKYNPSSRQVVLQIWNPVTDLPAPDGNPRAADIPCNLCSILKVRSGKLDWLQIMRSNDLFRGLPYNLVQFSYLQEIMAGWLGLEIGQYHHLSDSLHVYEDSLRYFKKLTKVENSYEPDTIACAKEESDRHFICLEKLVENLIEKSSKPIDQLDQLPATLPTPFRNIATVLVAEATRRSESSSAAGAVIETCENKIFRDLYLRWLKRVQKTGSLGD